MLEQRLRQLYLKFGMTHVHDLRIVPRIVPNTIIGSWHIVVDVRAMMLALAVMTMLFVRSVAQ